MRNTAKPAEKGCAAYSELNMRGFKFCAERVEAVVSGHAVVELLPEPKCRTQGSFSVSPPS